MILRSTAALLGLASCVLASSNAPPLSVSLETSWHRPPLALEILETLYGEKPESYLPALKLLSAYLPSWREKTDEALLGASVDLLTTHGLLPAESLSTFHYALGLHASAPKIEAYYQYYSEYVTPAVRDSVQGCDSWVHWRGKGFCTVPELRKDVEMSIEAEGGIWPIEPVDEVLPFDHILPYDTPLAGPHAILYFSAASPHSSEFLEYLGRLTKTIADFGFIVRYKPSTSAESNPRGRTGMTGYGVELALKKTDYLVVDDRATAGAKSGDAASVGDSTHVKSSGPFADALGNDPWSELSAPLKPSEVADVSIKAAALIMSSEDPLSSLVHLSQDFPKYSAAIARKVEVPAKVRRRGLAIKRRGQADAAFYINGKAIPTKDLDAFSLLKHIRQEKAIVQDLLSLGSDPDGTNLSPQQAFELVADAQIGQIQVEDDAGEGIFDASDRLEGEQVITWWNDIEKDKRYSNWPSSLQGLLRPAYPGQMANIRQNIFNVILVLDFAQTMTYEIVAGSIAQMIQRGIPIRWGVVPMFDGEHDESAKIARIIEYSTEALGRGATRDMMLQVRNRVELPADPKLMSLSPPTPGKVSKVTLDMLRQAYDSVTAKSSKESLPFDELVAEPLDEIWLKTIQHYTSRLGATKADGPDGHVFVNGKYSPMSPMWTQAVQSDMNSQISILQERIAIGAAPKDVANFFYDIPGVSSRRSKVVVPGERESPLRVFNLLEVFHGEAAILAKNFIYNDDSNRGAPISMWVVGDLDSEEGARLVLNALKHIQTERCASRLGLVHVTTAASDASRDFSTALHRLLVTGQLDKMSAPELEALVESSDEPEQDDVIAAQEFWRAGHRVAARLEIDPKQPHLLVNGRLIGPLTESIFPAEDFDALEVYEHRKRVRPVIDVLKTMYTDINSLDRSVLADLISKTCSIMAGLYAPDQAEGIFTPPRSPRNRFYEQLDEDGSLSFHSGNAETATIRVAAVLDTVSEEAQKWSALLKMDGTRVSVYLEPDTDMSEVKLKRFYRFASSPRLEFDVDGNQAAPGVIFSDLPQTPIFTLGMDTPHAWITSPTDSPYDLDNLVLGNIEGAAHVRFTLKQLLIEGHARDGSNSPTRGLQLQLTRNGLEIASDTLVMANLGYLQFKVTPGVYDLSIRSGRGQEVFDMESVGNDGWNSRPIEQTGTKVSLTSFEGVTILPRLRRKPGMEVADVLQEQSVIQETSMPQAVFSRMKQMIGLKPSSSDLSAPKTKHADINIFTVASGLLYERFASIMMLSVMKHTKHSVKFWFIENFLSPSFIEFVPKMAAEYGFQYEFVTYKFPPWLRAQTEKQRIIWAYKILFLDVLFPLDLDKIIFVDADQIVRVDMKELVDVDLHGRVYGMAPMGDSREEMEGFRFWKQGYWRDALRGRPYHISALYVVDLKRFRQLATGDRLRGQYHALSADPNSLANLDQDLPNSMQDTIPIWTLDQDWLWCQTWCSDESLATAKTIDLCQNPLTKEPKLVRARQIPEWDSYDREIAAFAARLAEQEGSTQALAASVDDLAAEKGTVSAPVTSDGEVVEDTTAEQTQDESQVSHHIEDEL